MVDKSLLPPASSSSTIKPGSEVVLKEVIPFKCVSWGLYVQLANKLDPDGGHIGNNWRMLAEKLGYDMEDINVFESQQASHGRNTIKVLQEYSQKTNSTVNALYDALEAIDRPDALEELKNGLPEILEKHRELLKRKHERHDVQENEYAFTSCDPMAYTNDAYNAFPASHSSSHGSHGSHPGKSMLPPAHIAGGAKYNMLPGGGGGSGGGVGHSGGMAAGLKYYRQKSADVVGRVDGRMGNHSHPHAHSHSHPHSHSNHVGVFEHSSPEFKRQRSLVSDSMMVRGHDNHSQYFHDHEPMDHAPSIVDNPVPLHQAMMRNMGRYNGQSSYSRGLSSVVQNKDPSLLQQSGFTRPKQSEMGLKLEIPAPGSGDGVGFTRQNFCSPGPTPTPLTTPLGRLEKLAKDQRYRPDEAYNDLMRMKQDEELLQIKSVGGGANVGGPFDQLSGPRPGGVTGTGYRHSEEMLYQRTKASDPPNTFPLRIKSNSCSSSSGLSGSAQLTKSHSLPSNMKSAEFRKAFRHISVFVTYAVDDTRHFQRVVNLCQCLNKNGFLCCGDEKERSAAWCQSRFEEADFILCVVSPRYRREVDTCEMDNDADDDSDDSGGDGRAPHDRNGDNRPYRLHTKLIYRLMYREFSQVGINGSGGGQRCSRFVPVLFQDQPVSLVPPWLVHAFNKLVYFWPSQYKDLMWMLTKPENRVPAGGLPGADAERRGENGIEGDSEDSDLAEVKLETD